MNLITPLKQSILRVLVLIDKAIYIFFRSITKVERNLIIFEGMMGRFDESSWVLYHYLKKKNKYRFVWMVKNPKQHNNTKDTKFISRYHWTFNVVADYFYAKAGFSFYTHTTSHIMYKRAGQVKVFIGHGYAIKGEKANGMNLYNNFDYGLVMGVDAIHTQAKFIGCDEKNLLPLGLPRNDLLINSKGIGANNPFVIERKFKKVILWMPTFRESKSKAISENACATETGLPLFDTEQKVAELNKVLSQFNCAIILKIHRLQMQKAIFKRKLSNIIIISDDDIEKKGLQLYEIVGLSDALLTDYSSISVDYLLVDKPIGYILNDIELYKKDRGFTSENPLEVMAGEFIYVENDCYDFISQIDKSVDRTHERRIQLLNKLHAAPNGNSCELIEKNLLDYHIFSSNIVCELKRI